VALKKTSFIRLLTVLSLSLGCGDEDLSDEPTSAVSTEVSTEVASANPVSTNEPDIDTPEPVDGPVLQAAEQGPDVAEPPALSEQAPKRIAARHILIAYEGAVQAPPKLRRSRSEAVQMAEQVRGELLAGADFTKLAKDRSDDGSAGRGGQLGAFEQGRMVPAFERAAFALQVAEVSEVVETPFGLHVIERMPLVEVRLGHVLVQWDGVRRSTVTRTQSDARTIAEAARTRLVEGEPLADVARQFSDGASGPRGGDLGWFQQGHTQPAFDGAFDLSRGEVGPIIESGYGYHVLVRLQ
jgi:parvulin-like peptidyl-prolyl isomerase